MNTQQLKELALVWSRSEVACMPIEEFSDLTGTPLEDVRVLFGAANVLDDLIDQLESAERERDELRAEIARRDAEAGEVIYQFDCGEGWQDVEQADYERYINARGISTRKVYTSALPAILPPELSFKEALHLMHENTWVGDANSVLMGANWMRDKALALGAQRQKVVELPDPVKWPEIPFKYFSEEQVFSMLDAAGVRWEVKK